MEKISKIIDLLFKISIVIIVIWIISKPNDSSGVGRYQNFNTDIEVTNGLSIGIIDTQTGVIYIGMNNFKNKANLLKKVSLIEQEETKIIVND